MRRSLIFVLLLCPVVAVAAISGVVPVSVSPQFGATPWAGANSYFGAGGNVSQTYMQRQSDLFVSLGFQAAWGGEVLIDIDEFWYAQTGNTINRDGSGHVIPSGNFTSMTGLTAYIKANGQIPGIYRDGGQIGCSNEDWGSGTLLTDLTYWFQTWGFQAVKSDGCGFFTRPGPTPVLLSGRTIYGSVDTLLKSFGTPFLHLYGYSYYVPRGYTQGWAFGPRMSSASWRASIDIGGPPCGITFQSVLDNARVGVQHVGVVGPYHTYDPDYLGANNNGVGGTLNTTEATTQMGLWAVLAANAMFGCDMANLGTAEKAAFITLASLTDGSVPVWRDPWVHSGIRTEGACGGGGCGSAGTWENWCRHLSTPGSRLIVSINENNAGQGSQTMTVDPSLCGLTGTYTLKNVMTGSTSSTSGTFSTGSLAEHASGIYLLTGGTESNLNCWATSIGGTSQIANGITNSCAFTADDINNPAGGLQKDGTTISTATAITTSGVTNPSAQGCYQKQRKGVIEDDPNEAAIGPVADNLVAGASYYYFLDLAEIEGQTAGQRVFNVTITNGDANPAVTLPNIDIASLAGGLNKAIRLDGTITASRGFIGFIAEPLSPPTGVPVLGCIGVIKQ